MTSDKIERFLVRSSDGSNSYVVSVTLSVSTVIVHCDCQAGVLGKLCKHKLAILTADAKALTNCEDNDRLISLVLLLENSDLLVAVRLLQSDEITLEKLKLAVSQRKKNIESLMNGKIQKG